jgi:hypothetical protein
MLRKGLFAELDPQSQMLLDQAGYDIKLVSVLAQAQKAIGVRPIQDFVSFVGGVASVDPTALDNINVDNTITEFADITGVPSPILRDPEEVKQIRQGRAQAQQQQRMKEEAMMNQGMQQQGMESRANTAKTLSEAGVNMADILGGSGGLQ